MEDVKFLVIVDNGGDFSVWGPYPCLTDAVVAIQLEDTEDLLDMDLQHEDYLELQQSKVVRVGEMALRIIAWNENFNWMDSSAT